jgi:hypothetical protein
MHAYSIKLSLLSLVLATSSAAMATGCASKAPPAVTQPPPMPTSILLPPTDEMTVVHDDKRPIERSEDKTPTTNVTPQKSAGADKLGKLKVR